MGSGACGEQVESPKDCLLGSHSSYIKGRVKLSTSPSTAPDGGQVGSGSISHCRAKTKSSLAQGAGSLSGLLGVQVEPSEASKAGLHSLVEVLQSSKLGPPRSTSDAVEEARIAS